MKKILIISTFILCATLFFIPKQASADYTTELNKQLGATAGNKGANMAESQDPRLVAALVIRTMLTLVGTIFLAYAVYGGYMIMSSAGNEEQITKGKSTLIRATIGVIVVLSAYSITKFASTIVPTRDSPYEPNGITIQEEPFDAIEIEQKKYLNTDPLR